jgi:hypothetical protein
MRFENDRHSEAGLHPRLPCLIRPGACCPDEYLQAIEQRGQKIGCGPH